MTVVSGDIKVCAYICYGSRMRRRGVVGNDQFSMPLFALSFEHLKIGPKLS